MAPLLFPAVAFIIHSPRASFFSSIGVSVRDVFGWSAIDLGEWLISAARPFGWAVHHFPPLVLA